MKRRTFLGLGIAACALPSIATATSAAQAIGTDPRAELAGDFKSLAGSLSMYRRSPIIEVYRL